MLPAQHPIVNNSSKCWRVRLLSTRGHYPADGISTGRAHLIVRPDLVATAVRLGNPRRQGITINHVSEIEYLSLEEIRFLGAITLCQSPDYGMLSPYAMAKHIDIPAFDLLNKDTFIEDIIRRAKYLQKESSASRVLEGSTSEGQAYYKMNQSPPRLDILKAVISSTPLDDHLAIRGLGALVRSSMLWQHEEFAEAAIAVLHIAKEASFELVRRKLIKSGMSNPSAKEAGEFLANSFGEIYQGERYFEGYHDDRNLILHTAGRLGVFPYPPLLADDFYFLRHALVKTYTLILTGKNMHKRIESILN